MKLIRRSSNRNFRFFALRYLNHWCELDKRFVSGLRSGKSDVLREALTKYGVVRNFRLRREVRLRHALTAIKKAKRIRITHGNVDGHVDAFRKQLEQFYGRGKLSASSKLMWFLHRGPVVMYDGNARRCLDAPKDYPGYRQRWRQEFAKHKVQIGTACEQLARVRAFSLAYHMAPAKVRSLSASAWFQQRVFDMFLWWNGNQQKRKKVRTRL